MDEHQKRQILQKAYAILDRCEDDEREHAKWLARHVDKYGILNLGQNEEIEPSPQQQRSSDEMVYKTFETPAAAPPSTDAQIFNDEQAEAIGYVIAHLRIYTREYVDQKLGELRAEIEVLTGVVRNNNVEVIKKRSNNVA